MHRATLPTPLAPFAMLALVASAAGCDTQSAVEAPERAGPATEAAALTGSVDLSFAIRGLDGQGGGSARILDEASGQTVGTCTGTCVFAVARNSRLRFVATPAAGSEFAGWHGVCHGAAADSCVVTITWHLSAGADFRALRPPAPRTYDLNVTARSSDGRGAGRVRVHDAAGALLGECAGGRCAIPVPQNTRVRLVANPEVGSAFVAWRAVCYGIGREDCYVTMSWHRDAYADFAADPPEPDREARELAEARAYVEPERARGTLRPVFAPFAASVERDGDDDPNPRFRLELDDGRERVVTVAGRAIAEVTAAQALRRARDVGAKAKLYRALYDEAQSRTGRAVGRFAEPGSIAADRNLLAQGIKALSEFLVAEIEVAAPVTFSLAKVRACLEGVPEEVGSDMHLDLAPLTNAQVEACALSPQGLLLAYDGFPKDALSCVKDQGARGTCTAFSVLSATEAALQQRYGQHVNLSEQHLYALQSGNNWTSSEGASAPDYLENLATYAQQYLGQEKVWNYNQSWQRTQLSGAAYLAQTSYPKFFFADSCAEYYETCSDNVAQAAVACSDPDDFWSCSLSYPAVSGTKYRFGYEAYQLWNADDLDETMIHVRAKLILEHQLVVSMALPVNFGEADADGFLAAGPDGEEHNGYHAMHVVGYITNPELALTLPGAPPGAGGGYFIVKNSWGPCFADGGYVYMPHDVMRNRAYSMMGFTKNFVEQVP